MSFTGVDSLDRSIEKTNAWIAGIAGELDTQDRRFAYRIARAWLHCLRDRLTVEVAAHFAAQLPEMLRGLFYDGWNPSHLPVKYSREEYVIRFAREARIHDSDVPKVAGAVTRVARLHMSAGVVGQSFALLPTDLRQMLDHGASQPVSASR